MNRWQWQGPGLLLLLGIAVLFSQGRLPLPVPLPIPTPGPTPGPRYYVVVEEAGTRPPARAALLQKARQELEHCYIEDFTSPQPSFARYVELTQRNELPKLFVVAPVGDQGQIVHQGPLPESWEAWQALRTQVQETGQ